MTYETILYEVDADDRVATITLNRPEALNAFDRRMCEEIRDAWHAVKDDDRVHAVVRARRRRPRVLRRARHQAELRAARHRLEPRRPRRVPEPEVAEAAGSRSCARSRGCAPPGAFYFLNEADVVICSDDATFFDSHVTYGFVSAIEPIGLMRRIGLGDTLRMALTGNGERVSAETALRLGLVTEVVERGELWSARPRARATHRVVPDGGHAGHGARDLGVARQALPRRDGAGPHVHAARQPDRRRGDRADRDRPHHATEDPVTASSLPRRIARDPRARPGGAGARVRGRLVPVVGAGDDRRRRRRRPGARVGCRRGTPVGVMLRNRPAAVGLLLGVLRADCCVVAVNSHLGARTGPRRPRRRSTFRCSSASSPTSTPSSTPTPRRGPPCCRCATSAATPTSTLGTRRGRRTADVGPASRCGCSRAGPRGRRSGSTSATTCSSGSCREPSTTSRTRTPTVRLRGGVVIVNAPLVHLGGLFRVLQAVLDGRRIALLERFTVESWADAVRRHQPKTVSLVPTALRMVLDADLDPAELASVRSVMSGTAPLDPDVADAFTDKYGVPVLTSYAATEFGGGVAGWNLADHQRVRRRRSGGAWAARTPGASCASSTRTPATVLGADEVGLLEVRAVAARRRRVGPHHRSRAARRRRLPLDRRTRRRDDPPRRVSRCSPTSYASRWSATPRCRGRRGRRARRRPARCRCRSPRSSCRDGSATSPAELLEHARAHLAQYELPVEILVVDALPRTPSAKVELAAVRALFAEARGTAEE